MDVTRRLSKVSALLQEGHYEYYRFFYLVQLRLLWWPGLLLADYGS